MKASDKKEYVHVCSICGMPLKNHQIAITIDSAYGINYILRKDIAVSLIICTECCAKMGDIYTGGMKKAIKRYEESMRM